MISTMLSKFNNEAFSEIYATTMSIHCFSYIHLSNFDNDESRISTNSIYSAWRRKMIISQGGKSEVLDFFEFLS